MLDKTLTGTVGGVSFTGEHELYGELLVVDNSGKTLKVCEQQVCAFVCSETACESDYKSVGVDLVKNTDNG